MSRNKPPSWVAIISFIVFYILGVVTSVIYGEEILESLLNFLLSIV